MSETKRSRKRNWKYLGLGLLTLLALVVLGFVIWASQALGPETRAMESLQSDDTIVFTQMNGWLVFEPLGKESQTGLILYPGARVDYRAYAPHAREISQAGFTVVIVRMPLNFAFFGINRAEDVIMAFPEVEHWAVGGHSLGGAMAAQFASTNTPVVDGLVLWASYPADSNDLSSENLSVISIYASEDALASLEEIESSRRFLPSTATFVEIEGGNHAGFGWYGDQNSDGQAWLSKDEQQRQIVDATVAFLRALERGE
jgi:pimeloyl-ACP methyl ester carboxylesterase